MLSSASRTRRAAAFVESGETEVSDTGGVYAEVGQRVDVDVCAG